MTVCDAVRATDEGSGSESGKRAGSCLALGGFELFLYGLLSRGNRQEFWTARPK